MTLGVSIHAPTGGATVMILLYQDAADVSIHAPTGGATQSAVSDWQKRKFQFTRPRGARQGGSRRQGLRDQFQFTRPRGARRKAPPPRGGGGCFNSRAHGGRDSALAASAITATVSIHAPTGGATSIASSTALTRCFNSRAHGGRDCLYFIISYRWPARRISANLSFFLDCFLLLSMIKYFAHAGSVLFFFREHPKGFLSTWGSRSVC